MNFQCYLLWPIIIFTCAADLASKSFPFHIILDVLIKSKTQDHVLVMYTMPTKDSLIRSY